MNENNKPPVQTFRPLNAREANVLKYHRDILSSGRYMDRGNGDITTFFGTRMGVGKDKNDPTTQILPTYGQDAKGKWRLLETPDEIAANAKRSGREFPVYKNDAEAKKAEDYIHQFMEQDIRKFNDARRPRMSKLMGMTNGGVW
jgi:hypothetical protein